MSKPIEFKAGTLTAMTAIIRELDNVRLADALHTMLGGMGEYFAGEAAVVDLGNLSKVPERVDWAGLSSLLRRYGLHAVAIKNAPESLHDSAKKAGFAVLNGAAAQLTPAPEQKAAPAPAAAKAVVPEAPSASANTSSSPTMVVDRSVRSGQQIYARGGDLVILGGVSHGAEVIADGSIHCYGPLRGRAIAGAQGDNTARLLITNFGPELISIAGVYRTFERGIPENVAAKPAHAHLRTVRAPAGDTLTLSIDPLQLD